MNGAQWHRRSLPATFLLWFSVAVILALVCGGTFALWSFAEPGPAGPSTPPASSTVTWEGQSWDCGQVNAWDQKYGAYKPDGTPIPYEVIALCTPAP